MLKNGSSSSYSGKWKQNYLEAVKYQNVSRFSNSSLEFYISRINAIRVTLIHIIVTPRVCLIKKLENIENTANFYEKMEREEWFGEMLYCILGFSMNSILWWMVRKYFHEKWGKDGEHLTKPLIFISNFS